MKCQQIFLQVKIDLWFCSVLYYVQWKMEEAREDLVEKFYVMVKLAQMVWLFGVVNHVIVTFHPKWLSTSNKDLVSFFTVPEAAAP